MNLWKQRKVWQSIFLSEYNKDLKDKDKDLKIILRITLSASIRTSSGHSRDSVVMSYPE